MDKQFYPGLPVSIQRNPMGFIYGDGVFGPQPERRKLDDIRNSLLDEQSEGPEVVYAIAMDVGKVEHKALLKQKMLLFGIVTYAAGKIGKEPVRSQGHIHAISKHSGWSPPELYEIWEGKAIVYMQETVEDDPGRCYAIKAQAGDVVLVPPGWAHCTINADPAILMTFGAWCDREYGYEYDRIRSNHGLAWYPIFTEDGNIRWQRNEHYSTRELCYRQAEPCTKFGLDAGIPIYTQFERNPDKFQFVSNPEIWKENWKNFEP
ncbi:MAG: hypothetical protein FWH35_09750 [Treponema sp.]|nr:hypothetical protein [Treponema sp.]